MNQSPSRIPALLFTLLVVALAGPLVLRSAAIAPLFLDASVRDQAGVALRQAASREGWLLSDLSIRRVDSTSLTVVRREHRRTAAAPQCFVVKFSTFAVLPCAD